jgi:hypothetical protein
MDSLTEEAQKLLYQHQNPENCSQARYLLWRMHGSGVGSDLHVMSAALATAITLGRVLIYHPEE